MGSIGDPITQPIPIVGTAGPGFATQINAFLTEVKSRLESKLSLSSVLTSLLDMTNNAIENLSHVGLYPQSGTTQITGSIFNYLGNLWWSAAGGPVQLTNGTALNAAAIGGITGDYGGANPAQLRFVDADKEYYFYDDFAGGAWADIQGRRVHLAAGATGATNLTLQFAGGSSKTYTLPPTGPATSDQVVSIDSTGVWKAGHGNKILALAPAGHTVALSASGTFSQDLTTRGGIIATGTINSTSIITIPINLTRGMRIVSIDVSFEKGTTGNTVFALQKKQVGSAYQTVVSGSDTTIGTSRTVTITPGTPEVISAATTYWLMFQFAATNDVFSGAQVTYDYPTQ